jgi:hypothetical protein
LSAVSGCRSNVVLELRQIGGLRVAAKFALILRQQPLPTKIMKPPVFDYRAPATLDEAVALLPTPGRSRLPAGRA